MISGSSRLEIHGLTLTACSSPHLTSTKPPIIRIIINNNNNNHRKQFPHLWNSFVVTGPKLPRRRRLNNFLCFFPHIQPTARQQQHGMTLTKNMWPTLGLPLLGMESLRRIKETLLPLYSPSTSWLTYYSWLTHLTITFARYSTNGIYMLEIMLPQHTANYSAATTSKICGTYSERSRNWCKLCRAYANPVTIN